LKKKVTFVEATHSPSPSDSKFCHIGIVRPFLSDCPSFFIAMLMSETSPIRNMAAVRKPRATGRVKKSDNALMAGFLERVGRVERSLLVKERGFQEAVEKAKVKAFKKRA
jgi:hypothetical protein